jgi:hypothetical protein
LIVVVLRKLVPLTVRVSGPDPAVAVVGLMEATVGVGVGVEFPELFPELPPEFYEDPPPPQPMRREAASSPDTPRPLKSSKDFVGFIRP